MPEMLRYRTTNKGTQFCSWSTHAISNKETTISFIEYSEGQIGELNSCEVELSEKLREINIIEKELIKKYPLTSTPLSDYLIAVDLKDWDFDNWNQQETLEKLTRSIQWNCKNTGLGWAEGNYQLVNDTYTLHTQLATNDCVREVLFNDLKHMGVLYDQLSIKSII